MLSSAFFKFYLTEVKCLTLKTSSEQKLWIPIVKSFGADFTGLLTNFQDTLLARKQLTDQGNREA